MGLGLTGTKSRLDVCLLPCAAAQQRVSTFPGAEERGWRLINKTGTPQGLLERSLVSGQLPRLPQDSREERQVIPATVLSTAPLSRRVPTGLAARCLEAKRHSCLLTPETPSHWVSSASRALLRHVPLPQGRCPRVWQSPEPRSDPEVC